uniref:Reverse transcriptase n=1 Tax=Beryx splendens TaxID=88663 RepID=A0A1V1GZG3_BERSP|nr:reverse transcriptase [Beryx splendens]
MKMNSPLTRTIKNGWLKNKLTNHGSKGIGTATSPSGSPIARRNGYRILRKKLFTQDPKETNLIFMGHNKLQLPLAGKPKRKAHSAFHKTVQVYLALPATKYNCQICNLTWRTVTEISRHLLMKHKVKAPSFLCKKCRKTGKEYLSMTAHVTKCGKRICQAKQKVEQHKCNYCSKSFTSNRGLSIHCKKGHLQHFVKNKRIHRMCENKHTSRAKEEKTEKTQQKYNNLRRMSNDSTDPPDMAKQLLYRAAVERWETEKTHAQVSPLMNTRRAIRIALKRLMRVWKPKENLKKRACKTLTRRIKPKKSKKHEYWKMQQMYHRDRAGLAKLILEGEARDICPIPLTRLTTAFKEKWEKEDRFVSLGQFKSSCKAVNDIFASPISPEEVCKIRSKMKNKAATGLDGISKTCLMRGDPKGINLANLFTAILLNGYIPRALKKNRTTLLPKTQDKRKLSDTSQWRPITIGSTIQRLLSGVINDRLKEACEIHPRQRGFISSPGCAENLMLLRELIALSKRELKPLAVIFIDFAKAFDTVSHKHIKAVLQQRGVDKMIIDLISNSYEGRTTILKAKGSYSREIRLKMGVKQGDPLSPLLFNLAIDPLLCKLDKVGEGAIVDGIEITSLAFADDIVLLSNSWSGMRKNLKILEVFCELTGLTLNVMKCHGFFIDSMNRCLAINECPPWRLQQNDLHMIGSKEKEKYLGMEISPWLGIIEPNIQKMINIMLNNLTASLLKPSQKLELLRTYAVPKLTYMADNGMVTQTTLITTDRKIRMTIKKWFHLNHATTDGLLYTGCKSGGMGLVKLARVIPRIQVNRILGLCNSEDSCTRTMARKAHRPSEFRKIWKMGMGKGGETTIQGASDIRTPYWNTPKIHSDWRINELDKWKKMKTQGEGIEVFENDKISNSWLRHPTLSNFSERDYILALKLRTNTYPMKAILARGRMAKNKGTKCRLCGYIKKTTKHVLGSCIGTRPNRMQRHNKICALLAKAARQLGWETLTEHHLKMDNGKTLVPDLIMMKDTRAIVADVTICYETNQYSLRKAYEVKVKKYAPLELPIKERWPGIKDVRIHGFPLGTRGKWPSLNWRLLEELDMDKSKRRKFASLLSKRSLLYTIDILKWFSKN